MFFIYHIQRGSIRCGVAEAGLFAKDRRTRVQINQMVAVREIAVLRKRLQILTFVHLKQIDLLVATVFVKIRGYIGHISGRGMLFADETVLCQNTLEQHHVYDGHHYRARCQHDQVFERDSLSVIINTGRNGEQYAKSKEYKREYIAHSVDSHDQRSRLEIVKAEEFSRVQKHAVKLHE